MKKQLPANLPRFKRKELDHIVGIARAVVPKLEMVILYGSYARGDYVRLDHRVEFGQHTTYKSDYDLLLVTSKPVAPDMQSNYADKIEQVFSRDKIEYLIPDLQFIFESIDDINAQISRRQYFYSDIKRQGVMLWDSGKYKLARLRKLNYEEIGREARGHYEEKYSYALGFLDHVRFDYEREQYVMGSFMLHQATENLFKTADLVFTLYTSKHHGLRKLRLRVRPNIPEVKEIFPLRTKAEKDIFDLLCRAYVEARYNPGFVVTKEDMDALIPRVEQFRDMVEKACREQMEYYAEMAEKEKNAEKANL